ncbi:hypothetical protein DSAG12_00342 [Promethearchaeum syntrophicum]|uniref:Acyl transferase n=1 Tax=Promethearchaeum syntrophicum TaxID=2594042 RepID=A0A5B9D5Y2_9ARCH|nr:hypothetical protein [Candidatus Prometheoarchaeum syntrophicum]QEE14529.1 hypothetical protein DSAG12_00342 [Candidatus Prometheoarchaeum syntrophicum]
MKRDPRIPPSAKIEMEKYIFVILFVWGYSWVPSIIMGYYYYKICIFPLQHIFLDFFLIFTSWKYVLISVLTPLFAIFLYVFRIFSLAILGKISISLINLISPKKELVSAKGIGKEEARVVNAYHLRGVILRIVVWSIVKSAFPWLMNWALNFVGDCKIGKGTTMEDHVFCKEYIETGKNVYIGQASGVTSHTVEGKYGAITLKKVYLGDNSVVGAHNAIAPGTYMEPYTEFLPMSGVIKFSKIKGFAKYFGLPISRLSTKRYLKMIQIPDDKKDLVYETKNKKKAYRITQDN